MAAMIRRLLVLACGAALPALATNAAFDAASATNRLGLDLYRQLSATSPTGNLVLSPYSINSALALAYAGADGATRSEMGAALHFPADDAALQAAFRALHTSLDELVHAYAATQEKHGADGEPIEWNQANRLFGQEGYDFRSSFLTLMNEGYGAPFEPLDFRTNAAAARKAINTWIESQTHGKIHDLIPSGGVNHRTRLVLVNALYLKAPWEKPFEESGTQPHAFHVPGIEAPNLPTMRRTAFLRYAKEAGFTVVALDYAGSGLQFLILLPDEGKSCDDIAARLTPRYLKSWAGFDDKSRPPLIDLYLPKFRIEGPTLSLGAALRALGVKRAFDEPAGSADFSRIAPRLPNDYLALSEVFHRSFVAVDENGTEAAAATAELALSIFEVSTSPPHAIIVRVDRPFLFAIQHRASGACLFLGRITDPR
jgi:serpin B